MTHALHYGTSVFEGVRCYSSHLGPVIFRLRAHTRRMYNSAKIYRLIIPFTPDEVNSACHQVIASNRLFDGAYIRPIAFRGAGDLRILPSEEVPVHVAVAAWQWGSYLGGTGRRRRCVLHFLAAGGAQHDPRSGQGWRQLPV